MKIAICGAGIGGLTAANLLHDAGHDIRVYERFDAPKPVGSGLMVQPYGQRILQNIGALDHAISHGCKIDRMHGIDTHNNRVVLDETYQLGGDGAFGLGIHRSGLFDALYQQAQHRGIPFHCGVNLARIAGQYLETSDQTQIGPFDLIINATGARSALSPMTTRPLAFGAAWSTVDWVDGILPKTQLTQRYVQAKQMVGIMPCGQYNGRDSAAIFWSLPTAEFGNFRTNGLAAWKNAVHQIWPEISPFFDQITDIEQFAFAQYGHGTLARPYHIQGRSHVVHIGDAAHTTSPQLGQGANMAMLDAFALTQALQFSTPETGVRHYAQNRRKHVLLYQAISWAFTPMYQSNSCLLPWLRDYLLYPISRLPILHRLMTRLIRGELVEPWAQTSSKHPHKRA